jgi:hypothetical protein
MFTLFMKLFIYFIRKKYNALLEKELQLTRFHNFVIAWTFFNFLLKLLNSIFVFSVLTAKQYDTLYPDSNSNTELLNLLFNITLRTMVTITDLLNVLTILYLFYF